MPKKIAKPVEAEALPMSPMDEKAASVRANRDGLLNSMYSVRASRQALRNSVRVLSPKGR